MADTTTIEAITQDEDHITELHLAVSQSTEHVAPLHKKELIVDHHVILLDEELVVAQGMEEALEVVVVATENNS